MSVKKHIGLIGLGRLGSAIVKGLHKSSSKKSFSILATVKSPKKARELSKQLKMRVGTDNHKLVSESHLIILAVKPYQAEKVLKEISGKLKKSQILISVCASITHSQLKKWTKSKVPVVRAMPNLPCLIGEGITAMALSPKVNQEQKKLIEDIFQSLGKTLILDEHHFDAVTALSACGPAFIFTIIESLIEAGVKVGIPRDSSRELVLRTLVGSGLMVEKSRAHPADLKDQVTTPAGCTIDGLQALEEGRLRATLLKAIVASTKRSSQLRKK